MIQIENVEVVGWKHAIRGMRNPMNSWDKSDTVLIDDKAETGVILGEKDFTLMKNLAEAGTDHRKFMRMIVVYLDITAPLYWWKEFDTYKVGTVANSCSTMHKIHEKVFTAEDFSFEHLLSDMEDGSTPLIQDPNDGFNAWSPSNISAFIIHMLNACRLKYLELDEAIRNKTIDIPMEEAIAKRKEYWWQMIQLLPSSYNQKRTVMVNYEVLANMYKSRRHHKLDEWKEFCKWIVSLPHSEIITGKEVKKIEKQ